MLMDISERKRADIDSERLASIVETSDHELATNAVKYGALSNGEGRWQRQPQTNRLKLIWQENGGPEVSPPQQTGFGTHVHSAVSSVDPN